MVLINIIVLIDVLLFITTRVHSENILGMFTSLSPSHLIIHMAMVNTLAEEGHQITVVSQRMYYGKLHPSITHIVIPPTELQLKAYNKLVEELTTQSTTIWTSLQKIYLIIDAQYDVLMDDRFKVIYNKNFDLLILGFYMNLYQLGLAAKFHCPIVMNWAGGPLDMIDDITGNPSEMSYVPTLKMSTRAGEVFDFYKRVQSFARHIYEFVFVKLIDHYMKNYYYQAFANETDFPTYDEMKQRISIVFSNYHSPSEGPIRPLIPSYIEVGGLQVKEQPDPLPQDLQEFLDNSSKGAILFSLGSNVQAHLVKPHIAQALFNTLSNHQLNVVWKWDDLNNVPGTASNILYKTWLPQDDILAHPNVKLFITHAGKGGIAEAQYHAVPMLALPIFGDQPGIAQSMVESGFGLSVPFNTLNEREFHAALHEILENPIYTKNVKKFSRLYRDRPLTARESVKYWTDYVLKYNGALHLQSPVLRMNFIARHNLDIYCIILMILYIMWFVLKTAIRFVHNKLNRQKSNPKVRKIKKN